MKLRTFKDENYPVPMSYGVRLLECRKAMKMTMAELGEALEVSPSSISLYEKELRFPRMETVMKMAELSGFSVDYLIGLTDVPYRLSQKDINDVRRVFGALELNWAGRPLDPVDLAAVRHLLETIVESKYNHQTG